MKNLFLYFLVLFACFTKAQLVENDVIFSSFEEEECDSCGCSTTGGGFGYGDLSERNTIILRYLYQNYSSKETIFNDSPWSNEYFNTIQALGLYSLTEKFKVLAIIPFHYIEKQSTAFEFSSTGLGDISLVGLYQVFAIKNESNWQQLLFTGVGVKLPTGQYNLNNSSINPGLQLGTDSTDFLGILDYQINYKNWGWQNIVNYQYKNENKNKFKFGNQITINSNLFYQWTNNQWQLTPQFGYGFEHNQENVDFGIAMPKSDGYIHLMRIGLNLKFIKFIVSLQYFEPLNQKLIDDKVKLKSRLGLGFHYNF